MNRVPRPSPAMAVALLALFIALGGGAYAAIVLPTNSVRSKHIVKGQVKRPDVAKGAVTSGKVADFSLLLKDFKRGQLLRGPQGPPGGFSGLERVEAHTDYGTTSPFVGEATAVCPAGKRVVGGGGQTTGSEEAVAITDSYPTVDLSGWVVNAIRITGSPPWRVTAYAICGVGN